MQDNLSVRLGFDSAEFLGTDLPTNIDGKAISETLSKSVAAIIESGFSASSRSFNLRVIVHCGQHLLQVKKPNEALYLVAGAIAKYQDRPAIAMIELKALKAVSRIKQLADKTTKLLNAPNLDPNAAKKYVSLLRRSNIHHVIDGSSDKFRYFFGDIEKYIHDPFGQTEKLVNASVYDPHRASERVMELRGLSNAGDKSDFMFRWRWGLELFALTRFVQMSRATVVRQGESAKQAAESCGINALGIKLQSLISAQSSDRIAEAIAVTGPNRSLVLAHSHSGLSVQLIMSKEHFPIPVSSVGNGVSNSPNDPSFHLRTGAESTVRDFAKLVKLSKREPRIVRIFADGQQGELYTTTLMGKPFTMGRGAATLAFLGGAATFFGAYELRNREFELVLSPGPDPLEFDGMDSFERAFSDFYAGCLERILLGPPEDIGIGASFWRIHLN